jgi:hypothetical protein
MSLLVEKPESRIPVCIVGLPRDLFEAESVKAKFIRMLEVGVTIESTTMQMRVSYPFPSGRQRHCW